MNVYWHGKVEIDHLYKKTSDKITCTVRLSSWLKQKVTSHIIYVNRKASGRISSREGKKYLPSMYSNVMLIIFFTLLI